MKFSYRLTFQDLLHLDKFLVQRRAGMSLFLLHFCGLTLGPLGVVVTAFCLLNWRSVFSPISLGAAFSLLVWLLCLWAGASSIYNAPWSMRRRLSRRVQAAPRLIEERTLGIVSIGVIEAGPEGLDGEYRFHCWPWQTVEKIEEEKQYIVLYSKLGETIFLPKACTGGPAATQVLMETMTSFWHSAKTGAPPPTQDGVWPPAPYRRDFQARDDTPEQ